MVDDSEILTKVNEIIGMVVDMTDEQKQLTKKSISRLEEILDT